LTPDNPRAQTLAWLFEPLPVLVESRPLPADAPDVHPGEAAEVATAVHRRRVEFATGRWCARRALARLGIHDFVLRSDPDRAPRWPAQVVGSITHTGDVPGGTCAVAVARAADVLALGLDAETGAGLSEDLWPGLLTPAEARWLGGLPAPRRPRLARLAFSAKECFYKAQFPLTRRRLEFGDVEVTVDEGSATFAVRVLGVGAGDPRLRDCRGRYRDDADLVLTGLAVPA
jgi:4'-phosphopantetheinyl transferase EntD